MAYYKIGRYRVFYSEDRFMEVNQPFLSSLTAHELISMKVLGIDGKPDKNALKLQTIHIEKLQEDLKNLPNQDFIEKWVEFDFRNEKAQDVVGEILVDYFDIYKNGCIIDLRTFDDQLNNDFTGENLSFPTGEKVRLQFTLSNRQNFAQRLFKRRSLFNVVMDLKRIKIAKGVLADFKIETDNQIFQFSENVEISSKG
ncbi:MULTISPECIES: hypothetical protein [unclassified Imperialibacter]|uniref:hypothetical protein n=1 Tax=unclassified Imperialibacter TaxID=2629706 RepID=UPI00125AA2AE|nr:MULTISPECIES: hypothetical protein [unclassified Imperialibacter]CAD5254335.1 hypothetical protein IMPERIA75_200101 [Imperialibacter sp. 75]CAD5262779.1 hypothetical protein IMPERIA89_290101 [Imperialibacter sp. 89]VVT35313.1 hypothetical protein IMPR6_80100 [Imperialibacter sp. EC-SDR9]